MLCWPEPFYLQNRRERISERLRTLQELVPNGTKVDLVTMLEKAISYVKFLQLQVKVLHRTSILNNQFGGHIMRIMRKPVHSAVVNCVTGQ